MNEKIKNKLNEIKQRKEFYFNSSQNLIKLLNSIWENFEYLKEQNNILFDCFEWLDNQNMNRNNLINDIMVNISRSKENEVLDISERYDKVFSESIEHFQSIDGSEDDQLIEQVFSSLASINTLLADRWREQRNVFRETKIYEMSEKLERCNNTLKIFSGISIDSSDEDQNDNRENAAKGTNSSSYSQYNFQVEQENIKKRTESDEFIAQSLYQPRRSSRNKDKFTNYAFIASESESEKQSKIKNKRRSNSTKNSSEKKSRTSQSRESDSYDDENDDHTLGDNNHHNKYKTNNNSDSDFVDDDLKQLDNKFHKQNSIASSRTGNTTTNSDISKFLQLPTILANTCFSSAMAGVTNYLSPLMNRSSVLPTIDKLVTENEKNDNPTARLEELDENSPNLRNYSQSHHSKYFQHSNDFEQDDVYENSSNQSNSNDQYVFHQDGSLIRVSMPQTSQQTEILDNLNNHREGEEKRGEGDEEEVIDLT